MTIQQTTASAMPTLQQPVIHPLFHVPEWQRFFTYEKAKIKKLPPQTHNKKTVEETSNDRQGILETRSDFELIDLTLEGDQEAFDLLVKRYSGSIYTLAYRMLRNQDDAADICQEVFLKAYEALRTFRKKSSFHTWLYRIATNSCINYLRKHSTQHHVELSAYHAVKEADTLEALYKIELQDVVNEAIEKLPEKQKATVMLRVCEGMSHREVSRILKCSVGTAKANYFHAIRNLRRFMKNYIMANDIETSVPPSLLRTSGII
ncbi:hypothetical protein CSA56_11475 [candidate division KSB3 bacterium]|uniref:RNA polymerase subunit sigma-24 n=1 Tax=candidate division KSB3 bacterium TaxID=2044937 RepID=A0A2G6KCY9_9BACT|nr:MAG: hypothetical protein CSA56_11475 [candidate division KSB3 bacterium]